MKKLVFTIFIASSLFITFSTYEKNDRKINDKAPIMYMRQDPGGIGH